MATAALAASVLLAGIAVLTTSESAAEPILGGQSFEQPTEPSPQASELADAAARFKQGDYDGVLHALEEAVKKNPDLPPAEVMLSQLYFQSNKPKEAKAALEQAVKKFPDDPEARAILGSLALREGDASKAEKLYQEAERRLDAFSKSAKRKELLQPAILRGLAMTAESRKDWATARRHYEACLKLDSKNIPTMLRLAFCLRQLKDADGALAKLREAAKIDAALLTPEAIMASFCEQSGDREGAKHWMAAALVAQPKDLPTRLAAMQWAFNAGLLDETRNHATAALRLDSKSLQAQFFLGVVAMLKQEYETGEMYFQKLVKRQPDSMVYTNNLAMALVAQDDESKRRQALEYAEANVKKSPKSADAASTYGWVLYKLGRLEEAEKALAPAASIAGSDPDTAYIIARVAVERGHKDQAVPLLEGAMKNTRPFLFRQETEELLGELKK